MRRILSLLGAVLFLLLSPYIAKAADSYFLYTYNNLGDPVCCTSPSQDMNPIGYLGETHPAFPGYYAAQTLHALPPSGYSFSHWSGDVPAGMESDPVITVTMDQDRSLIANFGAVKHTTITTRGYIHASPLLYDINHDGNREIIVGDMAGYVYCFNHLGTKLWEYYAGDAFDPALSPVPAWFNPEVAAKAAIGDVGNVTIQSACSAGDIDADTEPEVICGVGGFVDGNPAANDGATTGFGEAGQGGILVLDAGGSLKLLIRTLDTYDGLWGATQDGYSDGVISSAAIADIDGDGRLDFAIGGTDQSIYAFRTTDRDTSVNGTLGFFEPPGHNGLWAAPIYAVDNDGDGKYNEDPFGEHTPFTLIDTGSLKAGFPGVDDDGDGLVDEGGWPDDDEDAAIDEDEFEWPFRNTDTIVSSPALADLTGDGFLEVVIGVDSSGSTPPNGTALPHGGGLRVLSREAEEVGLFPQAIEQVVWSSPSVVDIDGDGSKEIFVGTGLVVPDGTGGLKGKALYAFNADGSPYLTGTTPTGVFAATTSPVFGAPAFGDVDGNGSVDVVAVDFNARVYAWNATGTPLAGFPMLPLAVGGHPGSDTPDNRTSPILADVDGDGLPEIVAGMGWSIVAVNGDGTMVPEFDFGVTSFTTGTTSVFSTPAAADLDNNGKLDLVWATGNANGSGAVLNGEIHIWELGAYTPAANPWPMFKRTGARTSVLGLVLENPAFTPPLASLTGGENLTVSVEAFEGPAALSGVSFSMTVNGTPLQVALFDDGSQDDVRAGDGRYTGRLQLPADLNNLTALRFRAQDADTETATLKVAFSFNSLKIRNLVIEYYNRVLDRAPDQAGEDYWTAEIERIVGDGIDIKEGFIALAKFFFGSAEYVQKKKSSSAYITDIYETFLDRNPDPAGLAYWEDYLTQGLSRGMLLNNFAYSDEFRQYMEGKFGTDATRAEYNLVNDFYRGMLNRLPDSVGFGTWVGVMQAAQCVGAQGVRDAAAQEALAFIQSAEYALRATDNQGYVEDLYNGFLRRGADAAGFQFWVDGLGTGAYSRESLLTEFVNSAEFQFRVDEVIAAGCLP